MNEFKAWAEPLQVPRKTYANWRDLAPEDVDFTFWCLETGKINEDEYLGWARNHYGLASIEAEFFSLSPDLVLWKRIMNKARWSEALVPVAEWEGVVFIACVEPPQNLQFGFPVRYLLAPATSLAVAWESLQRSSLPPTQVSLTEAIPTAKIAIETPHSVPTAKLVIGDESAESDLDVVVIDQEDGESDEAHSQPPLRLEQVDQVPTASAKPAEPPQVSPASAPVVAAVATPAEIEVAAQAPEEKSEENLFPELPPEPEEEEPMMEGLDPRLVASLGPKGEDEEEDPNGLGVQTKTALDNDILKGMPAVGGDGRIELPDSHGFTLSASLNKYLLNNPTQTSSGPNVVHLDTTAGTPMPEELQNAQGHPQSEVAEILSAESEEVVDDIENAVTGDISAAVEAMQSAPAAPKVPPPPPAEAQGVDSEFEGMDLPTAIIRNAKQKQEEARRAQAAQSGAPIAPEAPVASAVAGPNEPTATEMVASGPAASAVTCELPEAPGSLASAKDEKQVASYIFSQLQDRFEKSMILLFEGTKIRPWMWDQKWVATLPTAADAFDIGKACVFRIVRRTRLSYHGHVVKNDVNENFFRAWGYADLPSHVTICPIQYDSHLVGMVLTVGNKNCDTSQHLSYAERLTQQLSEAMQKVNSSSAA